MLTQKILIHAMHQETDKLQKDLKLMEKNHNYLLSLPMSKELDKIYYSKPLELDNRVKKYLKQTNEFIKNKNAKNLKSISKNSKILLIYFEEVVSIYQNELEEKISTLSKRQTYLLLFILLILLLEAIFIFKPVNKIINDNKIKLLQQSRSSAMGEMIENIAHQWRQPLSAISTIASGTKIRKEMDMINDDELIDSFEKILKHTKHLSSTIDDFRGFFKQDNKKTIFNIFDVVKHCICLTEASYKNNSISLHINKVNGIYKIEGKFGEMSQVILNIMNNAKDILKEKEIEEKIVYINIYEENTFCCIDIHDNAKGIPENIKEKVFEPYFTTKHKSQGTGIGLFMSKEIVNKHFKGQIEASNEEFRINTKKNYGACFSIKIPLKEDVST